MNFARKNVEKENLPKVKISHTSGTPLTEKLGW